MLYIGNVQDRRVYRFHFKFSLELQASRDADLWPPLLDLLEKGHLLVIKASFGCICKSFCWSLSFPTACLQTETLLPARAKSFFPFANRASTLHTPLPIASVTLLLPRQQQETRIFFCNCSSLVFCGSLSSSSFGNRVRWSAHHLVERQLPSKLFLHFPASFSSSRSRVCAPTPCLALYCSLDSSPQRL